MKKFFLIALASITAFACSHNKATIQGIVEGTTTGNLILKVLDINNQKLVDTIKIEEGKIDYSLKLKDKSPNFYYLYYKDNKVASLILAQGDEVKLSIDTLGIKTFVEGSEETSLLTDIEKRMAMVSLRYDSLVNIMKTAVAAGDIAKQTSVNYELGALYVKQKQYSIKHLYTHPNSIANITLLFQKFPNDFPIFADVSDVLLLKKAYDSLKVKYPSSVYVSRLFDEISYREKSEAFSSKLKDAPQAGFPNISLPDNRAKVRSLSEFSGKVIILSFWSVGDVNQKMLNRDFLQIYDKYESKGLEIYQVSVDADKTAWARAVDDQMLPWISVCDGLGSNSTAVKTYNVTKVPSDFIIDKSGTIVAKDVYGKDLENLISRLAK